MTSAGYPMISFVLHLEPRFLSTSQQTTELQKRKQVSPRLTENRRIYVLQSGVILTNTLGLLRTILLLQNFLEGGVNYIH